MVERYHFRIIEDGTSIAVRCIHYISHFGIDLSHPGQLRVPKSIVRKSEKAEYPLGHPGRSNGTGKSRGSRIPGMPFERRQSYRH